jgi:hypothetical protein
MSETESLPEKVRNLQEEVRGFKIELHREMEIKFSVQDEAFNAEHLLSKVAGPRSACVLAVGVRRGGAIAVLPIPS